MEARIGTCGSCNAKFKVPATFTADKAKCKKCGGVVTFEARAEPAAAAPKPAPKPVPARVPSAKPAAPAPLAPVPVVPVPAAPAPAASAPAPRPAVAAKPSGDALRSKVAAPAARVQSTSAPATATKAPSAGSSTATASRGAQRAQGQRAQEPSSSRAGRRTEAKRKSKQITPGMIVGMVVVLVALVAGGFFLFGRGGEKPAKAAETDASTAGLGGTGTAAPQQPAPAPEAPAEPASSEETAPQESAPKAAAAAPVKPVEPEQVVLLDLVAELPELEPVVGTDPALVEEMKGWMAEYVDPFSGAAGSRAGKRLQEQGKAAFPIIINAFRRLDFATEDGFRAGDLTQKLLERICNGRNFDWHYPAPGTDVLEPKDVLFNQKVVRNWYNIWVEAKDDEAKWLKLIKKDGAPEGEGDGAAPKPVKKLDDF